MVELHQVYALLYTAVAVLALGVTAAAWHRRSARGGAWLGLAMLGIAIWSGATVAMWLSPALRWQIVWLSAMDLGTWMVPIGVLGLALDVARMDRWLGRGRMLALSAVSFTLANLEWFNPGRLYAASYEAQSMGAYTHFEVVPGPLYWAFPVFAYTMVAVALVIMVRVERRSAGPERAQVVILLAGGLLPFFGVALARSGVITLPGIGLAPLSFLATGCLWLIAIARGTLLDILPVARGTLVEQMFDGVLVLDGQDRIVDANPAAISMLHGPEGVVGRRATDAFAELEGAADVLAGSGPRRAVVTGEGIGERRYIELRVTPLATRGGRESAHLVTLHDVTEDRRADVRSRLARTVFDTTNEGIVVALPNVDHTIIDVNDAYTRMTGRAHDDAVGTSLSQARSERHPPQFYADMWETLESNGEWAGELWQSRADGTQFPSWMSLTLSKHDEDHVSRIVGVFSDLSRIQEADALRYSATHDALTGLANRVVLEDRLEHALAHARRVDGSLAVLFLDVDHFKHINDTHGHARGDELLIEVARRILSVLRESDTLGRRSGDEFIVIISDVDEFAPVEIVARRLLEAVAAPRDEDSEVAPVTISIGVALFPTDGDDAISLMRHADLAMYRAKRRGRNRIEFFSDAGASTPGGKSRAARAAVPGAPSV